MSPHHNHSPSTGKHHTRKTAAAAAEPPLKCPRCDSPNTKFCYYNNYSLTQPRHFCKTCRRYWTKGGALRTVPIGGGCRKNKKIRSSPPLSGDSNASSSEIGGGGGLKFFQGVSPAMDFNQLNFNRPSLFNHFAGGGVAAANPYCSFDSSPLIGFDFPAEMGFRSSLASSIESLSSINQDLHWKMQKQRLAMMLPGDDRKNGNSGDSIEADFRKPAQPILFENLEAPSRPCGIKSPRKDGGGVGNLSTEWFFNNSYAAPATSNAINWSSGVQASSDLSQYSSIP